MSQSQLVAELRQRVSGAVWPDSVPRERDSSELLSPAPLSPKMHFRTGSHNSTSKQLQHKMHCHVQARLGGPVWIVELGVGVAELLSVQLRSLE